jgi:hypothetical protein
MYEYVNGTSKYEGVGSVNEYCEMKTVFFFVNNSDEIQSSTM